ncbi:hypothetical protein FPV67DRAFT_1523224 [Lyophyllum atratum]|nr:hypothetical protein FPV67DRAFT_1523224 [Lyophyllum atratum]
MAKGKKAKVLKKYKAPDSKYIVVVDPWGVSTQHKSYTINNIAAWFELMIRDDYPGEDVKTVFTQGTHNNVVVELSESVDILPYLGAHHHARFLKERWNATDGISYLYEYDYETQNDPTRRGWTADYPGQYNINIFPIKQPYPLPFPAPPPPHNVGYAKRPRNIAVVIPPDNPSNESASNNASVPRETYSPTHTLRQEEGSSKTNQLVEKRDPYEEADDAERLLKKGTSSMKLEDGRHDSGPGVKKEEPITHRVPAPKREQEEVTIPHAMKEEPITHPLPLPKREQREETIPNAVDNFLDSAIPKREQEGVVMPPSIPVVKKEPRNSLVKTEQSGLQDTYQPSDDLLAAFASLPPDVLNVAPRLPSTPSATPTPFVKTEALDDTFLGIPEARRSVTLATEAGDPGPSNVRVKPEPRDDYELPFSRSIPTTRDPRTSEKDRSSTLGTEQRAEQSTVLVKPEPRDHVIPPLLPVPRTRDPRLANRMNPHTKHPLDDRQERGSPKRMKSEE